MTLRKIDKDMIDPSFKQEMDNEFSNKINVLKEDVTTHFGNKANPHEVTKSQIGLASVQDYGVATQAEAETGTSTGKYMTPQRTKQAIDKLQAVKSVNGQTGDVNISTGGQIEDSGNNVNGSYIRFSDGTQICTGSIVTNANSASKPIVPPASFKDNTYVVTITNLSSNMQIIWSKSNVDGAKFFAYPRTVEGTFPTSESKAEYMAIGWWK